MLRIDVDHPDPGRNYGVPKDNPFVNRPGARPEFWAYGLRNPWRLSFDRKSGQLWVGKNGQDLWEQVYLIQKGANYGWSLTEGSHIFQAKRKAGPDPILPPTAEHPHSEARSLTGGRVYRGTRLPDLVGAYVYGDWSTGRVWGIKHDGTKAIWHRELVDTPFNITGFGTDHAGELYVIDHAGRLLSLRADDRGRQPSQPFPTRLSETGLFASVADHKPHPAALPFEVGAPQWADGATMERFAALPGLERIEQKPQLNAGGAWTLPNGSVLVQTLSLDLVDDAGKPARKRIETRLLVRQQGEWIGYSYRWNAEQTDAELVPAAGAAAEFEVADPTEPAAVASRPGGSPPAPSAWSATREPPASSWASPRSSSTATTITAASSTTSSARSSTSASSRARCPARRDDPPRLVNPYDAKAPLEARVTVVPARQLLDLPRQGGGRQRPHGAGPHHPDRKMHLIDEVPSTPLRHPDARLVAPGSPERSVLYERISRRGTGQMPPLVSTEVDRKAVKLIADWIRSLPPSPTR